MHELRKKSLLLTGYMQLLVESELSDYLKIITPLNENERGCQLSLVLKNRNDADVVQHQLQESGVICDERKPNCLRLAPVPLYNTFDDVWQAVQILHSVLK